MWHFADFLHKKEREGKRGFVRAYTFYQALAVCFTDVHTCWSHPTCAARLVRMWKVSLTWKKWIKWRLKIKNNIHSFIGNKLNHKSFWFKINPQAVRTKYISGQEGKALVFTITGTHCYARLYTHKGGETQSYTVVLRSMREVTFGQQILSFLWSSGQSGQIIFCVFIGYYMDFWQIVFGPLTVCCCFYLVELENKCHSSAGN